MLPRWRPCPWPTWRHGTPCRRDLSPASRHRRRHQRRAPVRSASPVARCPCRGPRPAPRARQRRELRPGGSSRPRRHACDGSPRPRSPSGPAPSFVLVPFLGPTSLRGCACAVPSRASPSRVRFGLALLLSLRSADFPPPPEDFFRSHHRRPRTTCCCPSGELADGVTVVLALVPRGRRRVRPRHRCRRLQLRPPVERSDVQIPQIAGQERLLAGGHACGGNTCGIALRGAQKASAAVARGDAPAERFVHGTRW